VEKQLAEQGALTMHRVSLFTESGPRRQDLHQEHLAQPLDPLAEAFYCRKAAF
jgi:hypothetical protein